MVYKKKFYFCPQNLKPERTKHANPGCVKRFTKEGCQQVINRPRTSLRRVNNMTLNTYAQINSLVF